MKNRNEMIIENRKAHYDYFIEDTLECGIVLRGNEVKSIASGQCNLTQSWCNIQNNNLVLRGMHISKWETSNFFDVDEDRERILLVHKSEIRKLKHKVDKDGITLIPLKIYFINGKCKVLIGICRGKKNYDKRESIKKRTIEREIILKKMLKEKINESIKE